MCVCVGGGVCTSPEKEVPALLGGPSLGTKLAAGDFFIRELLPSTGRDRGSNSVITLKVLEETKVYAGWNYVLTKASWEEKFL